MLAKLIKYEIKDTARIFLPFYVALLLFAIINMAALQVAHLLPQQNFTWAIPFFLTMTIYILLFASVFALTIIMIILRFYRNLLGTEGYLMFTLPVTPLQHILAKLAAAFLWSVCSCVVACASLAVFTIGTELPRTLWEGGIALWQELWDYLGGHLIGYAIEFVLAVICETGAGIAMVYAAIAIGHMVHRHRILGSFGAFLAINFATQSISSVFALAFLRGDMADSILSRLDPMAAIHLLLLGILLANLIFGGALLFITNRVLSRNLNLE